MVPVQMGALEHDVGDDAEHGQRDALLDNLELDEVEGASVVHKTQSVGGHLTTILKEGNAPREGDDADEGPMARRACFL